MKNHGSGLVTSALVGFVMAAFYGIADWPRTGFVGFSRTVVIGALIGTFIYACVNLIELPISSALRRHNISAKWDLASHVLVSLAGGILGGITGLVLGARIFGSDLTFGDVLAPGKGRIFLVTLAIVSTFVGFGFRGYELLRRNLSDTIARLKESEWAEKEIEMARSIQARLLPPQRIDGGTYVISARNLPARFVAGDFYDVVSLDDGSVAIIAADVAGKGMGASLIMASVKAVLPFVARNSVEQAMSMLNDKLVNELARREFVALAFARYFPADGALHLANAGFPDPYLLRDGRTRALAVSGVRLPLGIRKNVRYETSVTSLQPRDRVIFISDGLPEAPKIDDQPLGYERLMELIALPASSNGEWIDSFLSRVRSEVRDGLSDDWTAVSLEVRG
jgi:hypothetical protein